MRKNKISLDKVQEAFNSAIKRRDMRCMVRDYEPCCGHIESYSQKDGTLLLSVDDWAVRTAIKGVVDLCENKHGGFMKLEMSAPYKARTTGKDS